MKFCKQFWNQGVDGQIKFWSKLCSFSTLAFCIDKHIVGAWGGRGGGHSVLQTHFLVYFYCRSCFTLYRSDRRFLILYFTFTVDAAGAGNKPSVSQMELRLIQSKADIESPKITFAATQLS